MDEARIGQKGGVTHVWYQKGVRPRGVRQQGFASAYLFGAVCPERGEGVALVLPEVSTAAMRVFLAELARAVPAGTHAALVLDGAGWHVSEDLAVPANLTLIHPPPYSPELNPVERVWEYLRDRWLSHRVLAGGYEAVVDAACAAWNALLAEPGRLRSLTSFPGSRQRSALREPGITGSRGAESARGLRDPSRRDCDGTEHGEGTVADPTLAPRRRCRQRRRAGRHAGPGLPLPAGDGEDRQGPGSRPQALPGRPGQGQAAPGEGGRGAQGRPAPRSRSTRWRRRRSSWASSSRAAHRSGSGYSGCSGSTPRRRPSLSIRQKGG